MFEQYLQLLDTLREKQFSHLVRAARHIIVHTLKGGKFSPLVHECLAGMHEEGEPFTAFAYEPEQISQVKKLINSLYHAELALHDAETVNLRDGSRKIRDLATLYQSTIHHIYQAGYLGTHFDIDLISIFGQELAVLLPLLLMIESYARNYKEETKGFLAQTNLHDIPHTVGVVGGIVVDQLCSRSGEIDYEFLAHFGAEIPGYLDQLSGYIEQFSSKVAEHEPGIDKKKLEALQDGALRLLNALEGVRSSSWFLPVKTLHYIHIIRHTITLIMSIYQQIGHLNEFSQDTAIDKLAQLKYELFPALFELTDKIEEQAMLKPGMLSKPLMASVSRLYQLLINYPGRLVDFSRKGQALMAVEDAKFVTMRLDLLYQRIAEDKTEQLMVEDAKIASSEFFSILSRPQYRNLRMRELPGRAKQQLEGYYKIMHPYVLQSDIPLSNAIIHGLKGGIGSLDTLSAPLHLIRPSRDDDRIGNILRQQAALEGHFEKMRVSCEFHVKLISAIITSISGCTEDLRLFPHQISENPFAIDETFVLGMHHSQARPAKFELLPEQNRLKNTNQLTASQAALLYQFYQKKCLKLKKAQEAYDAFCLILRSEPLYTNDNLRKELGNLYLAFQPYFVCGLSSEDRRANSIAKLDQEIVADLSTNGIIVGPKPRFNPALFTPVLDATEQMRGVFAKANEMLLKRCDVFDQKIKSATYAENVDKPLIPQVDRAYHVIKHRKYSKTIAEVKKGLDQLISIFNVSVREQLHPADSGLPFPELEDIHQVLAQSGQALGLKRLFNCLYHLEQIGLILETLSNESTESTYAYHILQLGSRLRDAAFLTHELATSPYLSVLAGEIKQKLQDSYTILTELQDHYAPPPVTDVTNTHPREQTNVFFILNAMMILPKHTSALQGHQQLDPISARAIHQRTEEITADIERIIGNSSSYIKLFLEIPTMYRLFRELKVKLIELSTSSHDVVFDNLAVINDELLTRIILEADRWEDDLGLIPGTLTKTLKEILDRFYLGLLEPLGLLSKKHISLVSSPIPLDKRILAVDKRAEQAISEQQLIEEKREIIQRLLTRIQLYKRFETSTHSYLLPTLKMLLLDDFKCALPILKKECSRLWPNVGAGNDSSRVVDALLNESVENEPGLTTIEALSHACLSAFQGEHASRQLELDTVKEKKVYLIELKAAQLIVKADFIDSYLKSSFEKKLAIELVAHRPGLIYFRDEYKDKLTACLRSTEAEILRAAKNDDNINHRIETLLREKIEQFDLEHHKNYHHLDVVMAAIDQLRRYVDDHPKHAYLFENDRTLESKSRLVKELGDLARKQVNHAGEPIPVCLRLNCIKDRVQSLPFRTTMRAYYRQDSFTFNWLMQCVASLLELVGLYTPERKKCYNNLAKAVEKPPKAISQFSARFSMFSWTERVQPVPTVLAVEPFKVPVAAGE